MMGQVATHAVLLRLIFKLVKPSLDLPALILSFDFPIGELYGIYAS